MRYQRSYRARGQRRGVATVELALLLPLLLFLFLLSIDFARVLFYTQTVENCARNGAMYQSQVFNGTTWQGSSSTYATMQSATLADAESLHPALTSGTINNTSGSANGSPYTQVTVDYTYPLATNYSVPPLFNLGNQLSFGRAVQMRVAPAQPNFP